MNSKPAESTGDLVLSFLTCPQDAARGFLGALLITDSRSRPLHFAYVAPIRPTVMQRILYGSTLEEHIRVDVVTKKLFFEGLPVSPHVVFVDSVELLPARRLLGLPIARLSRQESKGDSGMSLSSLVYDVADEYLDQQVVGDVVSKLEGLIDLFEPFERMEKALKEVMRNENSK